MPHNSTPALSKQSMQLRLRPSLLKVVCIYYLNTGRPRRILGGCVAHMMMTQYCSSTQVAIHAHHTASVCCCVMSRSKTRRYERWERRSSTCRQRPQPRWCWVVLIVLRLAPIPLRQGITPTAAACPLRAAVGPRRRFIWRRDPAPVASGASSLLPSKKC